MYLLKGWGLSMNRNIVKLAGLVFAAFAIVIMYQTYIQVFESSSLLNHPRNRRLQMLEESITRGSIMDCNGRILAETVVTGPGRKRVYPYREITSNIIGYVSQRYGRWGLEESYNENLLGLKDGLAGDDFWALQRIGAPKKGDNLVLSLDVNLQQAAYGMLGKRKGAVVAIEPATGRILAMVSRPGYNPETVDTDWEKLRENPDSPLLNRAAQGLYPPGSIMKVVTAAGILALKPDTLDRIFDAPGFITVQGRRIEDSQARGRLSLTDAFAISSNFVFATLGMEQRAQNFTQTADHFGIGKKIPFELPTERGNLPDPNSLSKLELAESAIGQGRITVTPLNMALVAVAVANDGEVMAPTLVDEIKTPDGAVVSRTQPKLLWTAVDKNIAETLKRLMLAPVSRGTGVLAAISGVQVAGKTGSAQNPHGKTHAWFIGFAPAEKPRVAVAVIVENGGAGGREAAPIAREIMKKVIEQKR